MAPFLQGDSRLQELEEMYRAHRHIKDEELYGVTLPTTFEVPKQTGGLATRS